MGSSLVIARVRTRNVDSWREGVQQNFLPLEVVADRREGFSASLTGRQVGCAHLACVAADAHRVIRSRALAENSEQRYFKLFWQISGQCRIEQGNRSAELKSGTWTFYDTARPYKIEVCDSSRFAVMLLPQAFCEDWNPGIAGMAGLVFRSSGPSRVALASALTALRDPDEYDGCSAEAIVRSITSLMSSALRAESAAILPVSRLAQALDFIQSRCTDPDLTPSDVARALKVSRRTLYQWFSASGDSPTAFIQRSRLIRCRSILGDPAQTGKTITHIAFDNGFSDAAHFSRLFKATYGVGPREYRTNLLR